MIIRTFFGAASLAALLLVTGCGTLEGIFKPEIGKKHQGSDQNTDRLRTFRTDSRRGTLKVSPSSIRDVKEVSAYRLKPGDQIVIYLRSIPKEQRIEDLLDENGNVTLDYINIVHAAGRTASELEQSIQRAYIDQKIYKHMTVNVVILAQSYYVRGEVRQPGRYPLVSGVTIVQAIATAGGYTDYANPKKVKIIRGEETLIRNVHELEKAPEKDEEVEAGDVIVVPRGLI